MQSKSLLSKTWLACGAIAGSLLLMESIPTAIARPPHANGEPALEIVGEAELFAPDIASTEFAEVRLTISPDGLTALWFSRDRPGGAGGYDIWISRRIAGTWTAAAPVPFNSRHRDFDPAFSPDGSYVYFCSDRPGGMGGDDVYRVAFTAEGFGQTEPLGPAVNSAGNEFAPMLSPDQARLLFSSDRTGGAGRHDLYVSRYQAGRFESAQSLPGDINTRADEFDATFLSDNATIVFARAADFRTDRVDLFSASFVDGRYGAGTRLPQSANSGSKDTFGPMLDWSDQERITVSGQRAGAREMDLYLVRYTLKRGHSD